MKKVSTAAAKQMRNFSEPKLTIGLDLGDRSSWYCVLDERGEVRRGKKQGTTPKDMKEKVGDQPRSRDPAETRWASAAGSRGVRGVGDGGDVAQSGQER